MICTNCYYRGTESARKGSLGVEILLWLFFIIPGIVYSVWRSSSKICPKCGQATLVPEDSPRGIEISKKHSVVESGEKYNVIKKPFLSSGWFLIILILIGVILINYIARSRP